MWEDLREGDHLENPGADGRIILKWTSRSGMGGVDWIAPAQDRDTWGSLVNAVMNIRVP